ncbi:alpha-ketoglutarate-dependent dioxygenase AlkB family protein [Dichotomicrobium thermohalophilum]|uniref:DNA-N1-methyladenine dioxygenase n=1 Tax=Dichotomicrobium thermohalophilum TaxID=933063 RepID=A0A397PD33_9HYPH|nr:alpha-ketoglutarate-dependent dioxygenase AlkB [Dichotomicrobium thermohalophilum]RIA47406.1 DNA-N1-methyladenine dioxygenase [Dichotomicrobium thermohalophilum]
MSTALPIDHRVGYLDAAAQARLLQAIQAVVAEAPLFVPRMPRTGRQFSVRMTNCGPLGWLADKQGGYRYEPVHPETGKPWPPIPQMLLDIWEDVGGGAPPEACLINYYGQGAKMGLHQDRDEEDFSAPIVSVSLGDTGLFRVGGKTRKAPTQRYELASGDVLVMRGESRLAYHGIDRIVPGSSDLLPEGGRINITMRRVHKPDI